MPTSAYILANAVAQGLTDWQLMAMDSGIFATYLKTSARLMSIPCDDYGIRSIEAGRSSSFSSAHAAQDKSQFINRFDSRSLVIRVRDVQMKETKRGLRSHPDLQSDGTRMSLPIDCRLPPIEWRHRQDREKMSTRKRGAKELKSEAGRPG